VFCADIHKGLFCRHAGAALKIRIPAQRAEAGSEEKLLKYITRFYSCNVERSPYYAMGILFT
jgi:hypothetical protein